jgi:hypothetical protein
MRRRHKNAIEWAWVFNAVLNGSITTYSSPRSPQLWAIHKDIFSPFWASKSYSFAGSRVFAEALSEQSTLVPVLLAEIYFSDKSNLAWPDELLDAFVCPTIWIDWWRHLSVSTAQDGAASSAPQRQFIRVVSCGISASQVISSCACGRLKRWLIGRHLCRVRNAKGIWGRGRLGSSGSSLSGIVRTAA